MFILIRPANTAITFFTVIVAALICSSSKFETDIVLLAALAAALTAGAGNIINDIFDIEIDKISHPDRPLPAGTISVNFAKAEYVLLVIVSLLIFFFVNTAAFIIVASAHLLLFLYSFRIKKIPLAGNLLIASLTGLAFIYGGAVVNNFSAAFIPASFAMLINFIREIVKDMQDVEGDFSQQVISFPKRYGFDKSKILIAVISSLLIILTFYPFLSAQYKIEYFVAVMIIVNPIIVFSIKKIFADDSPSNLNKISNLLKLSMVFGLIAIYLGV